MPSKGWTIIVIAILILALDFRGTGKVAPGLLLGVLTYALLGALLPEAFIPLGLIVILYLVYHYWGKGTVSTP